MSDEIRPALSAEEWRVQKAERDGIVVEVEDDGAISSYNARGIDWNMSESTPPAGRHALAALCLYQQPFGFTQEDVDFLRGTVELARRISGAMADKPKLRDTVARYDSLIARISALLPPSDSEDPR